MSASAGGSPRPPPSRHHRRGDGRLELRARVLRHPTRHHRARDAGGVGGQVTEIPFHVRNVAAGVYDDEHPLRLAVERSAATLGDRARRSWPVDRIDLGERWVESAGRRLAADTIVIATGVGLRRLSAADDGAFGGDVTYQLGSDLDRFAGRPVVVIGGGDNATLDALALAQTESPVTLVHRSERLTSRPDIVEPAPRRSADHRTRRLGAGLGGWGRPVGGGGAGAPRHR